MGCHVLKKSLSFDGLQPLENVTGLEGSTRYGPMGGIPWFLGSLLVGFTNGGLLTIYLKALLVLTQLLMQPRFVTNG